MPMLSSDAQQQSVRFSVRTCIELWTCWWSWACKFILEEAPKAWLYNCLSGGYSTRRRLNEGMGPLEQHVACTAHQILNCRPEINPLMLTQLRKRRCLKAPADTTKSWFPGALLQCKCERVARDVPTNHGFQDHTCNA